MTEEVAPYIKEHDGKQICFADTIVQATNALKRTNLSHAEDANKLENGHLMLFGVEKFEDMSAFQRAFKDSKNTFTRLEIFGCEMDQKAQQELANAFDPASMKNIKTLDLDNTTLTAEGARAIFLKVAECQSIEKLNLQGSIQSSDVMRSIEGALVQECNLFDSLFDLDLKINDLKSDAAESISHIMLRMQPLKDLVKVDLFYNDIGPTGATFIAQALQSDRCCVAHLDLCCNNIGNDGAKSIGNALVSNRNLKVLKLALNNIGNEGAIDIFKAILPVGRSNIHNRSLEVLDLSANVMKEEVQKNVDEPSKDPARVAELERMITLINDRFDEIMYETNTEAEQKELSIRKTNLCDELRDLHTPEKPLLTQIFEVLQKSKSIKDVDITGIELDDRGWAYFAHALTLVPKTMTLRFSIVDLMNENNLRTVEEKIWNNGLREKFAHIDWRRRDEPAPATN